MPIQKQCADCLRHYYATITGNRLVAGHAHELVAAVFGYGNLSALQADEDHSPDDITDADILIPDILMVERRIGKIVGLPANLPTADDLVTEICRFLIDEGYFNGAVWRTTNVAQYILEHYAPDNLMSAVMDDLGGAMAETNAYFDGPDFEDISMHIGDHALEVLISGTMVGENDPDRSFSGDIIDFSSEVTFYRVAGKVAFMNPDVRTSGGVDSSRYGDSV